MVTRKRNLFRGRKWSTPDIGSAIIVFGVHLLALFAPFTFTWNAFFVGFARAVLCGLFGITLSYHRNLAHHSFKLPKWLEYIFAYIGVLAFQGDPIFWVSIHRYHHQYVDSEKDTHSPTFGFWYSHMGWLFDNGYMIEKYKGRRNVEDLKCQKFYRWVALITFGEGWHNNHHAFESSARQGLHRWEIDMCWYTIRFLEAVGLATNVKLPTKAQKLKKSFAASE
ncbi:hypothetical protein OSB04_014927 [Centaurea solstitialis]|uniref:Fatty acid desaturase domain-containing protein n=1 Tax=Centaurea solstitialis TaxID=347529 RepID=A0AA38W6X4_9ASTR|nr:hypothetical protein OSB04_014927 [Centaurea solstitialis]